MVKFKFLEHTADIKFQAFGKDLNECFENSALAISDYLSRGEKIKSKVKKEIEVKGVDLKSLLYNFLEEIVYLLDAEHFILSKAKVKISRDKKSLKAEISGDSADNYEDLDHIKAATYAEMKVEKLNGKCMVQAVMDV